MLESPQLTSFNMKALYFDLPLAVEFPCSIFKAELGRPMVEAYLNSFYPGFCSFAHDSYLIGDKSRINK